MEKKKGDVCQEFSLKFYDPKYVEKHNQNYW
jgi:hypothetical protein